MRHDARDRSGVCDPVRGNAHEVLTA
jgi:hypothetical protein